MILLLGNTLSPHANITTCKCYSPLLLVSKARPLLARRRRLVRKRCCVRINAIKRGARMGPIEGIWRSNFIAGCFRSSTKRARPRLLAQNIQGVKLLVAESGSTLPASPALGQG